MSQVTINARSITPFKMNIEIDTRGSKKLGAHFANEISDLLLNFEGEPEEEEKPELDAEGKKSQPATCVFCHVETYDLAPGTVLYCGGGCLNATPKPPKKPQLEIGKWHKFSDGWVIYITDCVKGDLRFKGKGFKGELKTQGTEVFGWIESDTWEIISEQEVKDMLFDTFCDKAGHEKSESESSDSIDGLLALMDNANIKGCDPFNFKEFMEACNQPVRFELPKHWGM